MGTASLSIRDRRLLRLSRAVQVELAVKHWDDPITSGSSTIYAPGGMPISKVSSVGSKGETV